MTETETTAPVATDDQRMTVETTAQLVAGTATEVKNNARQHPFTIDEPAFLGGTDKGATPIEHLLAALGSCQVISYQVWAQKLGLKLDTVDVSLTGDIDLAGFFGLGDNVRPGFGSINVAVSISGPETKEKYEELASAVATHCPVLDNLTTPVPVTETISVNSDQI